MQITATSESSKYTLAVQGRLDTLTSPELQTALDAAPASAKDVLLDFSALDYISSAGLRVLLTAHKKAAAQGGTLTIAGCNATVKDVFEITGFADIFTFA